MFKLKFFILFALAGLCFGNTSASETGETSNGEAGESSGNEASSDQKPAGTVNEGATVDKTFENTVGLPSWITEKKSFLKYITELVPQPKPQGKDKQRYHQLGEMRVQMQTRKNEHGHVKQLPENTPCGTGKICKNSTCVEEPVTLPSCR
uniref:Putative ixodes 8-cys protein n=1 Tax=Ixodes ricinus TaxID=34613 RepID=A0A0K8RBU5_IXORI